MKVRYSTFFLLIAVPVVIFALVMLLIQAYLPKAITSYIENSLEEKIGNHLDQAPDDLLEVNVQKLKLNAFPLTVLTPEISIYAATDVYNEDGSAMLYTNVHEAGVINLEISLKPLVLIALGQRKFNVNRLQVDSVYYNNKRLSEDPGAVFNSRTGKQNFRFFKTADIQSVQTKASGTFRQKFQSGQIRFKGKIGLPENESNALENLTIERHSFQAENIAVSLPQYLYSFHIDNISIDGIMETISIEKIKILPIHPKEEFYRHVDFETDRIETHLDIIEIKGFQTHKKHGRRGLMFSQVNIRNGFIDISRDRRPPFNEEQRPALPAKLIMTAPVDLFVAGINISETDILYSEFPEDGSGPGFHEAAGNVPFNSLEASVKNITNIADSLDKDSVMYIHAETHIFDDAVLRADFRYNLNDIDGGYSADAELSELRFETINPAIYPLTGMRVAEGIHKSSVFSFSGNDVESSGELYMEWNDLLLDFSPDAGGMIAEITKSLGKIIYHQSNPDNLDKYPSGEIYYERDIRRFVFHYWWNCYLSGIKNSVLL